MKILSSSHEQNRKDLQKIINASSGTQTDINKVKNK